MHMGPSAHLVTVCRKTGRCLWLAGRHILMTHHHIDVEEEQIQVNARREWTPPAVHGRSILAPSGCPTGDRSSCD